MLIVGLTGGIATGKSTVSAIFQSHGIPVIDADILAREIVEPGEPALQEIAETFGKDYLKDDGTLDRPKLGKRVFSDPEALADLNRITHTQIHQRFLKRVKLYQQSNIPIVIYDMPLLFECKYSNVVDCTVVVYTSEKMQLERLIKRNQFSQKEAQRRINSQIPIEEKKKLGDYLIDNSKTIEHTKNQIKTLLISFKSLL